MDNLYIIFSNNTKCESNIVKQKEKKDNQTILCIFIEEPLCNSDRFFITVFSKLLWVRKQYVKRVYEKPCLMQYPNIANVIEHWTRYWTIPSYRVELAPLSIFCFRYIIVFTLLVIKLLCRKHPYYKDKLLILLDRNLKG